MLTRTSGGPCLATGHVEDFVVVLFDTWINLEMAVKTCLWSLRRWLDGMLDVVGKY